MHYRRLLETVGDSRRETVGDCCVRLMWKSVGDCCGKNGILQKPMRVCGTLCLMHE